MRLPDPDMPRTKYYAEDEHPGTTGKAYMDIREMAARLPGHFSFILWDVCFMGGIEVAYELRNKTDYMIASPAEVISDGFPYEKMMPLLWGGEEAMKQICREYYNHYNKYQVNSLWRSAVVGLVKTEELEPLVAKVPDADVREFPENNAPRPQCASGQGSRVHGDDRGRESTRIR